MPATAVQISAQYLVNGDTENPNVVLKEDRPIHDWYRLVLSYPPHLVRKYLEAFSVGKHDVMLDPFCGAGTTLVECRKNGISAIGIDAHPIAVLASKVKTCWDLPVDLLGELAQKIHRRAGREMARAGFDAPSLLGRMVANQPILTEDEIKLIPEGFLSQKPLRRLLFLRAGIEDETAEHDHSILDFFRLALCHVVVNGAGNFAFGPEIYRTKAKDDYDVLGHFALQVDTMIRDLRQIQAAHRRFCPCSVLDGDARILDGLEANSCDAVICSPPYPNEKDYTRLTRVESVLLGLIRDRKQLRSVKQSLLRSNTRNVFVDDQDGEWVKGNTRIQGICHAIEKRREELGKTSGFERLYHRVVAHYFGGMARHFEALRAKLKARSRCAYVVGDQLSFLLVPVPTASLLAEIAEAHGFKTMACDPWRTRFGTKSGTRVREEVLILEKR
ncbi:MAG: DNA methyltransferase [Verrucomicrobiia bacterium]